jgi:GT2 family glycosyltransferase
MNPQTRKYYVLLVHYGDSTPTDTALSSLINCQQPPDKIFVIDHGKTPFTSPHSQLIIVKPEFNAGYFAGINTGLGALVAHRASPHDIVVVMNNDIKISPTTFVQLRAWWQKHPQNALLGISNFAYVNLFTGRANFTSPTCPPKPCAKAGNFPYIHGAFFSAPYHVFMSLRGLPDRYFLYWEDVLLSTQVSRLNIPLRITKKINIIHHQQPPAPASDQLYYLVRNGALFLERETPLPWRFYWWIINRLRFIYHSLRTPHSVVGLALRDAIKNKTGPRFTQPSSFSSAGAVVVTYRTSSFTLKTCLKSLHDNNIKKIVVVDNENDPIIKTIARQFTAIYLSSPTNLGFASAANLGGAKLSTQHILFLNPDAQLSTGACAEAVKFLLTHPHVGIVGLTLVSPNGQPEKNCFGPPVTPLSLITRHFFRFKSASRPGWVSGGAMLIRRRLWLKLKGFDPRFFLYWEDVDLCRRAHQASWQIAHLSTAKAIHHRGASSTNQNKKTKLYDKSADNYFRKHYPKTICLILRQLRLFYRLFLPQVD